MQSAKAIRSFGNPIDKKVYPAGNKTPKERILQLSGGLDVPCRRFVLRISEGITMKKLGILALLLSIGLCNFGCGDKAKKQPEKGAAAGTDTTKPAGEEKPAEDGK